MQQSSRDLHQIAVGRRCAPLVRRRVLRSPRRHEFTVTLSTSLLQQTIAQCLASLAEDDVYGALALLNARTKHRYTGLYRFDPPLLRCVSMVDRENRQVRVGNDAPIEDTYCAFVRDFRSEFATADASADERPEVIAFRARSPFQAYCGFPLLVDGECVGSLCHFDTRPRLVPTEELQVLAAVAPLFTRHVR